MKTESLVKLINERSDSLFSINKLHKILYYIHAWHLVKFDKPLTPDKFLTNHFSPKSMFLATGVEEETEDEALTSEQYELIDDVLEEYGDKTNYYLDGLAGMEEVFKKSKSKEIMSNDDIKRFFTNLYLEGTANETSNSN